MSRQCWETPERRVDRIVGVFACRRVATGGLAVDAFADLGLASLTLPTTFDVKLH